MDPAATALGSRGDAPTEKFRTLMGHTLPINSLAFSPNGRWLASGSLDKTAKLWDVTAGREVRTFTGNLSFTCVEFSPDGRQLVLAASDGAPVGGAKSVANSITLWDSSSPNGVRNLAGHEGLLYFVKFSPDGRLFASTDGAKVINIWDVGSSQIIKVFKHGWLQAKLLGGTLGSSLAFTPDGRFLASRSRPATLWDVSRGKEACAIGPDSFSLHIPMFLGITPDGRSLVEANSSGKIRIWDVPCGKEARYLADPPSRSGVSSGLYCGALSSDGKLLAVATYSSAETPRQKVTLWDVAAGRILGSVAGGDSCEALAFSPDGQWLAIGDMEYGGSTPLGKIRLWRTSAIR
jgi:WD40 repeat protein